MNASAGNYLELLHNRDREVYYLNSKTKKKTLSTSAYKACTALPYLKGTGKLRNIIMLNEQTQIHNTYNGEHYKYLVFLNNRLGKV